MQFASGTMLSLSIAEQVNEFLILHAHEIRDCVAASEARCGHHTIASEKARPRPRIARILAAANSWSRASLSLKRQFNSLAWIGFSGVKFSWSPEKSRDNPQIGEKIERR